MPSMRTRATHGFKPGDAFTITRTFTQEDTQAFGRLTRDYNPVHYDQGFARTKGLEGLILHGLLTGSMICEAGGQVAWLATSMDFRFKKPVYFGDTITCRITITEIDSQARARARAIYTNQHGQEVVSAELSGQLPQEPDRAELKRMQDEGDPTNPLRDR